MGASVAEYQELLEKNRRLEKALQNVRVPPPSLAAYLDPVVTTASSGEEDKEPIDKGLILREENKELTVKVADLTRRLHLLEVGRKQGGGAICPKCGNYGLKNRMSILSRVWQGNSLQGGEKKFEKRVEKRKVNGVVGGRRGGGREGVGEGCAGRGEEEDQ